MLSQVPQRVFGKLAHDARLLSQLQTTLEDLKLNSIISDKF